MFKSDLLSDEAFDLNISNNWLMEWSQDKFGGGVPKAFCDKLALYKTYNAFNETLFKTSLPYCDINIVETEYHGFACNRNAANGQGYYIALSRERMQTASFKDVLSTLVHEMVHIADFLQGSIGVEHTYYWGTLMKRLGLVPIPNSNTYINSDVVNDCYGDSVHHHIVRYGQFDLVSNQIISGL